MTAEAARAYHRPQITTFADTQADLITAMTLAYPDEAIGIAQAARDVEMPVVLSFTLETDGNLPDGSTLAAAIQIVDDATDAYPAYYMINCAHPSHFASVLDPRRPVDWPHQGPQGERLQQEPRRTRRRHRTRLGEPHRLRS